MLFSPDNINSSTSAKWTTHNSLGGLESLERVGTSLSPLSFSLLLRSDAGVSARQMIDRLESYVKDGKAGIFVLGNYALKQGAFFVMESVSDAYGMILRGGQILSAKVDVKLKEYN